MELKGTVLNVVDFGAFVDIGLKDSGLVHISQLANRYIKSPHDVVSVGDVVTVWVMSVDQERKRVSLTMVKPGTERQRGAAQGGQRRGQGASQPAKAKGQGQGRRDRARTPRPSGSALTSPPVGAPRSRRWPSHQRPARSRPRCEPGRRDMLVPEGGHPGPGDGRVSGQAFPGSQAWPRVRPGPAGQGGSRADPSAAARSGRPGPGRFRPDQGGRNGPRAARPLRPSRPSPPPPPLSKEALSGSVPLRTFGQLKQLWEARVDGPGRVGRGSGTFRARAQAAAGRRSNPRRNLLRKTRARRPRTRSEHCPPERS